MANSKITELDAVVAASTDDLMYLVDDPGSTPTSKSITFDNMQKSITAIGILTTGVEVAAGTYVTVGPSSVDGNWRMGVVGGELVFQKRVSGAWVTKGSVS